MHSFVHFFNSVNGFVERNRDTLPSETRALMQTSTNSILSMIFSVPDMSCDMDIAALMRDTRGDAIPSGAGAAAAAAAGRPKRPSPRASTGSAAATGDRGGLARMGSVGPSRKQSFMKADTVTIKFRSQLSDLMTMIGMTNVQYVRCIKPNSLKSKIVFDRNMVSAL